MSKPATDMRLLRAAEGFTEVVARGNAHIITKNPTTGKCAYDCQVGGGWHYGAGQETDTAWLPGIAPWNWQMTKALYNVFALSQFNNGQIIKWLDPVSGQYVTFQPMALQWTNSLNQIQQISMPQSVAAQANDDILYWPAAYGSGRNFKYQACPDRLSKQLIIDAPSALPSTSYDTLELNFIIAASSGVDILVDIGDGQGPKAWDKKSQKDTTKAIAFQLPGGAVLWSFAIPRAWDSAGNETNGSMRLKKSGSRLYVSVRFPKAWIDSAVFPIMLDPTLDYQVGASANDGVFGVGASYGRFDNTRTTLCFGSPFDGSSMARRNFMLFTGVEIPVGATITAAYLSLRYDDYNYGSPWPASTTIAFEDDDNPSVVTSDSDGNGRTLTSNTVAFAPATGTWVNTPSIIDIISELLSSYDYSSGKNMQVYVTGETSGNSYVLYRTYNYSGNVSGPKLHIEYTEAASGNPFYAYAQQ